MAPRKKGKAQSKGDVVMTPVGKDPLTVDLADGEVHISMLERHRKASSE